MIPPVEMDDDDLMSEEFERQAKIASQAAEERKRSPNTRSRKRRTCPATLARTMLRP